MIEYHNQRYHHFLKSDLHFLLNLVYLYLLNIRVLQLLAEHPVERIQNAIEHCRLKASLHTDLITQKTQHLAKRMSTSQQLQDKFLADANLLQVHVPKPDLTRFD